MTISFRSAGTVLAGTGAAAPVAPAGVVATDLLVLPVWRRATGAAATLTGWTLLTPTNGLTVTVGAEAADSGTITLDLYIAPGGTAMPTLPAVTGGRMAWVHAWQRSAGVGWLVDYAGGTDPTVDTTHTAAAASALAGAPGTFLLAFTGVNGDAIASTRTGLAWTWTGATLAANTARNGTSSTTGNDLRVFIDDTNVTAGTPNAAPSLTWTWGTGATANTPASVTGYLTLAEDLGSTDLVLANAATTPTADAPALTQDHNLTVNPAATTPTADNVAVTTASALAPADASTTPTAGNVDLAQVHQLTVNGATTSPLADTAGISQAHALSVAGATSSPTADGPLLSQVHELGVAGASSSPTAEPALLDAAGTLAPAAATTSPTADTVVLSQVHNLAVDSATSTPTAEVAGVSSTAGLAPAPATTTPTADAPLLTQVHNLTVAGATSSPTAEAAAIGSATALSVADATTTPTAQAIALAQAHQLVTADATSLTAANGVAIAVGTITLLVQGGTVTPLADTVTLGTQAEAGRIRVVRAVIASRVELVDADLDRARVVRVEHPLTPTLEARLDGPRVRAATIDLVDLVDADIGD